MSRIARWVTNAVVVGVVLGAAAAHAQAPAPPTPPFAPAWGMLAGWDVFAKKGCGGCHALRGVGPVTGPDLGRISSGTSFFDVGAAMWNHLPRMGEQMHAERIERPKLTPADVENVIAFVFTARYFDELGDGKAGQRLFAAKGCVTCHAVGGAGGKVGPALDAMKRANSPVLVAAAMWNHGPEMAEMMKAQGVTRPTFKDGELVDVIAYIVQAARDTPGETAQVVPGTPSRGQALFADKQCATCHAVGGKGGTIGPDLGRSGHHVSLTQLAARMWNHGPAMWAKMNERKIPVPKLSGQDMADVLAYLYTNHYFDAQSSAARGGRLVRERGCTACHSVRGQGGKAAADFATSTVVGSPASVVAAMWNHSARMETTAEAKAVAWPVLTGAELGDITAYLVSLRTSTPARPR
ncbi:MAG TPA: c-type cytochrome [Candidatus Binatia bacterium]|nr:c-type cytochrome [Candidatus Binatia bacterium]